MTTRLDHMMRRASFSPSSQASLLQSRRHPSEPVEEYTKRELMGAVGLVTKDASVTQQEMEKLSSVAARHRRENPFFSGEVEKDVYGTVRPFFIPSDAREKPFVVFDDVVKGDKVLGKGNFKGVYCAVEMTGKVDDGKKVRAVGIMPLHDKKTQELYRREMEIMHKLQGVSYVIQSQAAGEINAKYHKFFGGVTFVHKGLCVMECCTGGDLGFAANSLSPHVKQQLALECLLGLQGIHARGVLHRDIKPQNILLASEGGELHIRIADFGLACRKDDVKERGHVVGTPAWISPEVLMASLGGVGKSEMDYPNDVWAMGATLYYLFSGHLFAFQEASSIPEFFLQQKCLTDAEIEQKVKADIDATNVFQYVILGMMKLDPNDRWTLEKAIEEVPL